MEVLLVIAGALATTIPSYFFSKRQLDYRRATEADDAVKRTFVQFFGIISSIEWLSLTLDQRVVIGD